MNKAIWPLLLALSLAGMVFGQEKKEGVPLFRSAPPKGQDDKSGRSVHGVVTNSGTNAPIEGAFVQLKDLQTQKTREVTTLKDGLYHFNGLDRSVDYELIASRHDKNSAPRRLSLMDPDRNAVRNLRLRPRPEKRKAKPAPAAK